MKIKNLIILIGLATFLGCIDQIPIDIKENQNEYLIIDAELRDNTFDHVVKILINSAASGNFQADFPVTDAEVYVLEDGEARFDFATTDGKGNFFGQFQLFQGRTYELIINYKGIEYRSEPEINLAPIDVGELRTIMTTETINNAAGNVTESEILNLLTSVDFPTNENVYVRYGVKGTYEYREIGTQGNLNPQICFVDEIIELDNLAIASNQDLENGRLENKLIIQRVPDYRYAVRYCMQVQQERISKSAYDFWKLVENEYSRTGDIFEKPPGIIRGNISEQSETDISAVGLFSVISVASKNLLIQPSDAGSPTPECRPFPRPPATCTNCLLIPKSTRTRPECFQ